MILDVMHADISTSPACVRDTRLWRERDSAASPSRKAARDVSGVLSKWGGVQNAAASYSNGSSRESSPQEGKAQQQQQQHPEQHRSPSPARIRNTRLWRGREFAGTHTNKAARHVSGVLSDLGELHESSSDLAVIEGESLHKDTVQQDPYHHHYQQQQPTFASSRIRSTRLWRQRESLANPACKAGRDVGTGMEIWVKKGRSRGVKEATEGPGREVKKGVKAEGEQVHACQQEEQHYRDAAFEETFFRTAGSEAEAEPGLLAGRWVTVSVL